MDNLLRLNMTECDCLGCEHPIALINSPNFISLLFNAITFNIIYKTFLSNNNCVSMREKNVIVQPQWSLFFLITPNILNEKSRFANHSIDFKQPHFDKCLQMTLLNHTDCFIIHFAHTEIMTGIIRHWTTLDNDHLK